ncbi:MAG TPA: matrixin family metalloprotease [Tahibacter sp.]|uniref:matrixin family metalloprotease n=1 Tax=Tahibacter sp. TaxID=2056211 RepID=UPI002C10306E|nr:matrixin family metalloprotease [Tahibacter sp.]HSX59592.1 matrixin family metalloprotease [Tahibacter sp.]
MSARSVFRIVCSAVVACCTIFTVIATATASQLAPQSADELASAPRIVVADLESAQSRWNPQRTLIVTDYRFRRVEALRGTFDAAFVLTQGGGTVGDETHRLSDLPLFRTGARYLLILNAADNPVFSSVRYGAAGALELDGAGERIVGGERLDEFRVRVRRSAVLDDAALRPAAHGKHYPASVWRPEEQPVALPMDRPAAAAPAFVPPESRALQHAALPGLVESASPFVPHYLVQRWPAPTITFNQLPLTWAWSPYDQHQMAHWNQYGDIFRVLQTPTGTWAWTNDRYDLAGFPNDTSMQNQFGAPWGATTLAICYSRWFGSGPIVESDIALNPAYDWTLDEAFGTEDASSPWSFRQSLLHELGHSWGLQHPWETQNVFWPSTMNYGPKWARDPALHSDDTAAIRAVYPGIAQHDGSLAMYRTTDSSTSNHATYTPSATTFASYTHGQNLGFTGAITLQNLGTTNLVNPAVDVYLTAARMRYENLVYLGRSNYTTTVAPFPGSISLLNLGSYFVASSVPTGLYFPVVYLAASGGTDAHTGNNAAWGVHELPVRINNAITALAPAATTQYTGTGRIGPSGDWRYSLAAQAGYLYTFSTCGLAAFDTVIEVRGAFPTVAADDSCGAQTQLSWRSAANQNVTVVVRGYDSAAQGAFQLAYGGSNDQVFRSGFQ